MILLEELLYCFGWMLLGGLMGYEIGYRRGYEAFREYLPGPGEKWRDYQHRIIVEKWKKDYAKPY